MRWVAVAALVACGSGAELLDARVPNICEGRGNTIFCNGDTLIYCAVTPDDPRGVVANQQRCDPGMCKSNVPSCVVRLGSGPGGSEPLCPPGITYNSLLGEFPGACDGNLDLGCANGFVTSIRDCGGNTCHQASGYSVCVTSTTPEPACDMTGIYHACSGQTSLLCIDDLVVSSTVCTGACSTISTTGCAP